MNNASRTKLSGGRLRTITFAALVLGLSAHVGWSQDLSRYREFPAGRQRRVGRDAERDTGIGSQDHPSAPRTATEPRVEAVVFHERVDGAADRSGAADRIQFLQRSTLSAGCRVPTRSGQKA